MEGLNSYNMDGLGHSAHVFSSNKLIQINSLACSTINLDFTDFLKSSLVLLFCLFLTPFFLFWGSENFPQQSDVSFIKDDDVMVFIIQTYVGINCWFSASLVAIVLELLSIFGSFLVTLGINDARTL